jgi:signal transduction histidine kinase
VIRGILDFSRPAPPDLKSVSIHQILDSSLLSVEKEIQEAGVHVRKQYDAGIPLMMLDSTQISQVFVNLFLNAVQSMKGGGDLRICTASPDGMIEVVVEDTGIGITPEQMNRIYDPFFTTRPDGVGLGLAVVTRTLEQHHATIRAESAVAKGTRFIIQFPMKFRRT